MMRDFQQSSLFFGAKDQWGQSKIEAVSVICFKDAQLSTTGITPDMSHV